MAKQCDNRNCPAPSYVKAHAPDNDKSKLRFCLHHFRENALAIEKCGWIYVIDTEAVKAFVP